MMQIVIDISEKQYEQIVNLDLSGDNTLYHAVKNGTPLPKGHGELVDRDAINDRFDFIYECAKGYSNAPSNKFFFDKLYMCLNTAPTIIKAEGSESE